MKVRTAAAIFALACFALIAGLVLILMRAGEPIYEVPVEILLAIAGILVAVLLIMGILFEGKERWTVFVLAAILLTLFSALLFFEV